MAYTGRRLRGVTYSGFRYKKGFEVSTRRVISVCKRTKKDWNTHFVCKNMTRKWFSNLFIIKRRCIYSIYKMQCSKPFANRRYTKGVPFQSEFFFSSCKGWDRGAKPPRFQLCWVPPNVAGYGIQALAADWTGFDLKTVQYNPHG